MHAHTHSLCMHVCSLSRTLFYKQLSSNSTIDSFLKAAWPGIAAVWKVHLIFLIIERNRLNGSSISASDAICSPPYFSLLKNFHQG